MINNDWEKELENLVGGVEFLHGVPVELPEKDMLALKDFIRKEKVESYMDGKLDTLKEVCEMESISELKTLLDNKQSNNDTEQICPICLRDVKNGGIVYKGKCPKHY